MLPRINNLGYDINRMFYSVVPTTKQTTSTPLLRRYAKFRKRDVLKYKLKIYFHKLCTNSKSKPLKSFYFIISNTRVGT